MKDKTILEKIRISDKVVKKWKERGLKITYPIRENYYYFKSADGEAFVENADKFVPHLTKKEARIYIKYPQKFREDFLKNLKFYRRFCNFIYKIQKRTKRLKGKEKIASLLSLLYLFQRAMDYHYFHWDRYLVYEDYPQTPVGYWLDKLQNLYTKTTKRRFLKQRPPEDFLKLLSLDKENLEKFKKNLSGKDFLKLKKSLMAIKIFENIQEKEVEMIYDFKTKENILVRTGFTIMDKIWEEIKYNPKLIKKKNKPKIKKIMKLYPIIVSRKLLLVSTLKCFDKEIFSQFKKEIKRWL